MAAVEDAPVAAEIKNLKTIAKFLISYLFIFLIIK